MNHIDLKGSQYCDMLRAEAGFWMFWMMPLVK
jgi:hypothetical protein